jgi:hypothetical protein
MKEQRRRDRILDLAWELALFHTNKKKIDHLTLFGQQLITLIKLESNKERSNKPKKFSDLEDEDENARQVND